MRFSSMLTLSSGRVALAAALACAPLFAQSSQQFRIAAWNVGGLSQTCAQKAALARELFGKSSDVVALQECDLPAGLPSKELGRDWQQAYESSNVILSRWPIVRSGTVAANPAWTRELPWADIQPPSGPVFRVYSVHLTFKRGGNPFLDDARAVEARRILVHASRFEGPVVLAGDFNSVGWILGGHESEPAIRLVLSSGYADAFAPVGGRTNTFLGRLDWIFATGFDSAQPVLGDYAGSDHRWLLADLWIGKGSDEQPQPAATDDTEGLLAATLGLLALIGLWRLRRLRPSRLSDRR